MIHESVCVCVCFGEGEGILCGENHANTPELCHWIGTVTHTYEARSFVTTTKK